jgi:gliding motility-associated-like protein
LSNPNIANPNASPGDTTTYYLTVTENGCSANDSVKVNVNPLPVIDVNLLVSVDASCNASNGSITGIIATGAPTLVFSWSNGTTVVGTNLDLINQPLGNYTLSVTDGNGCVSSFGPVQIGGGNPPVVNIDSVLVVDPSCNLANGSISNVLVSGGTLPYTYNWSLNGNPAGNTLAINQLSPGWYVIVVTDSLGCFGTDSVFVNSGAFVNVLANDDYATTLENVSVQINPLINDTGGTSITILNGPFNGVATGSVLYTPNTGFYGIDTIVYEICDLICTQICDTARIYIEVEKDRPIKIYDGFSPNGDGVNETFYIENIDLFPENELLIYSRWGDLVYSAQPYNNEWDGTSKVDGIKLVGDKVVDGTYYFILKLSPDQDAINGFIDLRR